MQVDLLNEQITKSPKGVFLEIQQELIFFSLIVILANFFEICAIINFC